MTPAVRVASRGVTACSTARERDQYCPPRVRARACRSCPDRLPAADTPGQIEDPVRSVVMGLPPGLEFRTKGQLAIDISADALADGITFDFFCGVGQETPARQLRSIPQFLENNC
jgi:hypothetical protein